MPEPRRSGGRLRIWLVPSQFFPHRGGVEELSLKLSQHLVAAGHDVLVVTNEWPRELPARDLVEGIPVARLPFEIPARHPRTFVAFAVGSRRCRRGLAALPRPDVIDLQCMSTQLPAVASFARSARVPLVVSTQGEVQMDPGQIFQRNWYLPRVLRRVAPRAAALTACSEWTREATARDFPDFARAVAIPNGVDPEDWPGGPLPAAPRICAWGRLVPQKGFDLLLSAFSLLRRTSPEATLEIGGSGPELPRLRELAGPGVTFAGALDRAGVLGMLQRSRIAVVPSRIEPFGIVALEALAAGRGLVFAAGTGLVEAAGPCGRAADVTDPAALAAAMAAELAEPTPVATSAPWVASRSWSQVAAAYEQVLRQAAAANSPSAP